MPNPSLKLCASSAYENAHLVARDLLQAIEEALNDMPAPDNDDHPIHWGHVADVVEVNRRLSDLLAFCSGDKSV